METCPQVPTHLRARQGERAGVLHCCLEPRVKDVSGPALSSRQPEGGSLSLLSRWDVGGPARPADPGSLSLCTESSASLTQEGQRPRRGHKRGPKADPCPASPGHLATQSSGCPKMRVASTSPRLLFQENTPRSQNTAREP